MANSYPEIDNSIPNNGFFGKDVPIYPQITFQAESYDPVEFASRSFPGISRDEAIRQLNSQTIWVEGWPYPLKHGDLFTLYGSAAIAAQNSNKYHVVSVYYGVPTETLPVPMSTGYPPTPTASPATTPAPTPTPTPGPFYTTDQILYLDAGNSISYPGDGSGPWFDLSSQANNATLTTVAYNPESQGIMNFNGSSSGGTLTASKYNVVYSGKTVFVAARMAAHLTSNTHRAFLGEPTPANRDFNFYMNRTAGGDYRLHFSSATYGTYSSNISVVPNQWFIVAVTHGTDGTVKYYLNGVFVSSTSQTFAQYAGASGIEYVGRADNYWNGDIAVIGVYSNELTASQISQNYFSIISRFENPSLTPLPTPTPVSPSATPAPTSTSVPPTPTPTSAPPGTGGRLPQPSESLSYNGITLTGSGTGVQNYSTTFTYCSVSMPVNSMLFGQSGSGSYTVTFSEPVNDIAIYGSGQNAGETFTFSVNNGTLTTSLMPGVGCNAILTGNTVGNSSVGSFGAIVASSASYTSITITFPGGGGGTLFSIQESSVVGNSPTATAVPATPTPTPSPSETPVPTPTVTSTNPTPTPTSNPNISVGLPLIGTSSTVNGVTLTASGVGTVYNSNWSSCSPPITITAPCLFLGRAVGTYTCTFSSSQNDVVIFANASDTGEEFIFGVNNGTLSLSVVRTCGCTITGTTVSSVGSNVGWAVRLTSTLPYTELTIYSAAVTSGSLFGIYADSVL